MITEGIKATKILSKENIATNVTLVFSPLQALIAAKAGASYVSPFIGRLDDITSVGMEIVENIVTIYDNYGFETEVIVEIPFGTLSNYALCISWAFGHLPNNISEIKLGVKCIGI